jgi:hypothetical protein
MPDRSVSSCDLGPVAADIVVPAPPVAMAEPEVLAQYVPELLAAVESVVFAATNGKAAVDEPRSVVPRAPVPRLEVPRLAIPCTTAPGEEFGAAGDEEFAAPVLFAVAVDNVDVETELVVAVVAIPDVLTVGHGSCVPPVALYAPGGRPLIVVPMESGSPPPSKVGKASVLGLGIEQGAAVPE